MPSRTDARKRGRPRGYDPIDKYHVGDDREDPFATPEPQPAEKKRKAVDTLGIDEEITITRQARAPAVKLDEAR